jgi:hypothetical protein
MTHIDKLFLKTIITFKWQSYSSQEWSTCEIRSNDERNEENRLSIIQTNFSIEWMNKELIQWEEPLKWTVEWPNYENKILNNTFKRLFAENKDHEMIIETSFEQDQWLWIRWLLRKKFSWQFGWVIQVQDCKSYGTARVGSNPMVSFCNIDFV